MNRKKGLPPVGRALNALLSLGYRAAAAGLPVARNRYCFTSFPDASDSALAMFLCYRRRRPDAELVWLVDDIAEARRRIAQAGGDPDAAQVRVLAKRSPAGILAAVTSRVYFHTHGFLFFGAPRRGQLIVNLWHGMPLKVIGTYDGKEGGALPLGHVTLATSDFFAGVMAKAFSMPKDAVWTTGLPRNDAMVAAAASREPGPRRILWMPTYRASDRGEVRIDGEPGAPAAMRAVIEELDRRLAGRSDVQVDLRLHPMDTLNRQQLELRSIRLHRATDPGIASVDAMMAASDRLITDYSSAFIDYALLRRPMAFFVPDAAEYRRGFVPEVRDRLGWPGTVIEDVEGLERFILDPAPPLASEEQMALLHDEVDGGASDRLFERIEATLGSN